MEKLKRIVDILSTINTCIKCNDPIDTIEDEANCLFQVVHDLDANNLTVEQIMHIMAFPSGILYMCDFAKSDKGYHWARFKKDVSKAVNTGIIYMNSVIQLKSFEAITNTKL